MMVKQNKCNIDYKDKEAIKHISNTLLNIKCWFFGILITAVAIFLIYTTDELAFPEPVSGWQFVPFLFTVIGAIILCGIIIYALGNYHDKHKL